MNFVGHIYLSGDNEKLAVGNFIGDYVKGSRYERYQEDIRKGILLHRDIDATADAHPAFIATRELFKPCYGRYAGVVVDMAFDHVLTKGWSQWHDVPLRKFTRSFYGVLLKNFRVLPLEVKEFLPFMIRSNRLYSYSTLAGIERALSIMSSYTSLPNEHVRGIGILQQHEKEIAQHFAHLLGDMVKHLNAKYDLPISSKAATQIERHRTLGE